MYHMAPCCQEQQFYEDEFHNSGAQGLEVPYEWLARMW